MSKLITILLVCSLIGNAVLGFLFLNYAYQLSIVDQAQQAKVKVIAFTDLFVQKVLTSNQDVDFDTRLTLETMVRELEDQEIFEQWQRFTQTTNTDDASKEAKALLNLLIKKISQ